jgi:hypothetical protein
MVPDVAGREEECRAAWVELIQFSEHTEAYWQKALSSARAGFERWTLEHPRDTDPK